MNVILFQVKTCFVCNSTMFYGTILCRQPYYFVNMSASSKKALLSTLLSTEGLSITALLFILSFLAIPSSEFIQELSKALLENPQCNLRSINLSNNPSMTEGSSIYVFPLPRWPMGWWNWGCQKRGWPLKVGFTGLTKMIPQSHQQKWQQNK